MNNILPTPFGEVRLSTKGYYVISKGENRHKPLHRAIFEDFYNINLDEEFPEGIDIHHIDGNKTNNEIWNLEPITHAEHQRLHRTGVKSTDETKILISKVKNNKIGYFRVSIKKDDTCSQGFRYRYRYSDNGKEKSMYSVDLDKLKEKVKAKGLKWIKFEDD